MQLILEILNVAGNHAAGFSNGHGGLYCMEKFDKGAMRFNTDNK